MLFVIIRIFTKEGVGYEPKMVLPDAFYDFSKKLGELLNLDLLPETEVAALKLFDKM